LFARAMEAPAFGHGKKRARQLEFLMAIDPV
jgi:hypothetical protein